MEACNNAYHYHEFALAYEAYIRELERENDETNNNKDSAKSSFK